MALTRKFLTALGIDSEKVDEIISAHTETVEALKAQMNQYKEDASKLADVQKELNDLKADPTLESKYNDLKAEYEKYKADTEAKELKSRKTEAYKKALIKAGVSEKRLDSVLKVSDVDKIELDKDGEIKDSAKLVESLKNEWADFVVSESKQGAKTATPPNNTGGTALTRAEIMKIKDTTERQKAWADYISANQNGGAK